MPTPQLLRVDWDLVYPPLRDLCFELVARCNKRGAAYFATSAFRSPEEQLKLWAKGRNADGVIIDPKAVVTKKKFGYHNLGLAADLTRDTELDVPGLQPGWARDLYDVLAEEASKLGLEPGHYWKGFPDSPHIQLLINAHNLTINRLKTLYDAAPAGQGIAKVWAHLDRYEWPQPK